MTGYDTQINSHSLHKPLYPVSTQRPNVTTQQPPTISRRSFLQKEEEQRPTATAQQLPIIAMRSSPQEEEEQRTTATTQQPPAVLRRPSPNEVQPMTIYPQQACTALFKALGKRTMKLKKPQIKPTYHKMKTQSCHPQEVDSVLPPASRCDQ